MFTIDMRTVIFFIALIDIISLIVIAFLWYQNRKLFAGLSFWVADYALQLAAMPLILLRGSVPDLVSMALSNTMVIGGTLLLFMGLQRFLGQKSRQVYNYIILAVFVLVHTYFTTIQPNLEIRSINLNAALLIFCFQCMWLTLRSVDAEMRSTTLEAGIAFGGLSLVSLLRIIGLVVAPIQGNDFFNSGVFDTTLLITQQLFFIFLTFSLILMMSRRLFREVEKLSMTDSLTGFLNRSHFEPAAERALLLAIRHHQPLSLIFLDIDRFKKVNDLYGHEMGDTVLAAIANTCRQNLRTTDISMRLGGEEYAFLCPHTDSQGAFILAERIRKAIPELVFSGADTNLKITVSIGISEVNDNGDTIINLIKRADEAMYQAKNQGRNKSIVWKDSSK